jgi:hypothetical protein
LVVLMFPLTTATDIRIARASGAGLIARDAIDVLVTEALRVRRLADRFVREG